MHRSGNIVDCMNNTGAVNPNNRMSIGYIDSDSLGLISASGAHFVKINGFQVFDGTLPATSARLKDLRCGDYPYWANWNMVIRTNGVDGVSDYRRRDSSSRHAGRVGAIRQCGPREQSLAGILGDPSRHVRHQERRRGSTRQYPWR